MVEGMLAWAQVGSDLGQEETMADEESFTLKAARRGAGSRVSVEKAEGGYIVSWSEAEVLPERKRGLERSDHTIVHRRAVREKLEEVIALVREVLESDRVVYSKGSECLVSTIP